MGQERFHIRSPRPTCCEHHDYGGDHPATFASGDFERWRTEMFAAVEVGRIVDFITPLLRDSSHPHRWEWIGLTSWCRCGWSEREFVSKTPSQQAWWEHARDLLNWDAVEAEYDLVRFERAWR